ncbi:MAG: zinc ribbon domain-containing protein [Planctomycetota bacterium]
MPTYQYYCADNDRTLEVMHGMSTTVETWGELCGLAEAAPGNTPSETPVEKRLGTGMVLAKKPEPTGGPGAMHGGGCCDGMCSGH